MSTDIASSSSSFPSSTMSQEVIENSNISANITRNIRNNSSTSSAVDVDHNHMKSSILGCKEPFFYESVALHFCIRVYIEQYLIHTIHPLFFFFSPNPHVQRFFGCHPILIWFNHLAPMLVEVMVISYMLINSGYGTDEECITFSNSIWYPLAFFLSHRSSIAVKYAAMSPREYLKYMMIKDMATIQVYDRQMLMLGAWGKYEVRSVTDFELVSSALRLGCHLESHSFLLPNPLGSIGDEHLFLSWKAFLMDKPDVKLSDPCCQIEKRKDSTCSVSLFNFCRAARHYVHIACVDLELPLRGMALVLSSLLTFIPISFVPGLKSSAGKISHVTSIFVFSAAIIQFSFTAVLFEFIFVALYDVRRQHASACLLTSMLRISDLSSNLQVQFNTRARIDVFNGSQNQTPTVATDGNQKEKQSGGGGNIVPFLTDSEMKRQAVLTAALLRTVNEYNRKNAREIVQHHLAQRDSAIAPKSSSIISDGVTRISRQLSYGYNINKALGSGDVAADSSEFDALMLTNSEFISSSVGSHTNPMVETPDDIEIGCNMEINRVVSRDSIVGGPGTILMSIQPNDREVDNENVDETEIILFQKFPRISTKFQENYLCWAWARQILMDVGFRYRFRLNLFVIGCLLVNALLMILPLYSIFRAPINLRRKVIFSPFVQQAVVAAVCFTGFLVLYTSLGAMVNHQLRLHRASLSNQLLRTRERLTEIERKIYCSGRVPLQASNWVASSNTTIGHGDESLIKEQRKLLDVEDAIRVCIDVVQSNNDNKPFRVLNINAQYAVPLSIVSFFVSFIVTVVSAYRTAEL